MAVKMPQPLGGVFSVVAFAMKHGLLPGIRPGAPAFLFIHGGGFIDCGVDFCDPNHPLVNVLGADLRGLPPATVITWRRSRRDQSTCGGAGLVSERPPTMYR